MDESHLLELQKTACQIRRDIIEMLGEAKSGHPGGSLSSAEILTYLYFHELNIDPENPQMPDRDRFVLSKGHAAPVLYATLAKRGFFPKDWLKGLRKINNPLQGHPDMRQVPGVEMSTGSLGTGFSTAIGMALAAQLDKSDRHTYVVLGDGELQEGQVWEAAMAAAHYQLKNLIAFCDHNGLQIDGYCQDIMNPTPIDEKFRAFGWEVQVIDGNNMAEVADAVEKAKASSNMQPKMILCHTVKGKGVSFMEGVCGWHGKAPAADEVSQAVQELSKGGY